MEKEKLYFIALIPPAEIREKVTDLKLHFKNAFKAAHALKSPPHITLIPPFKFIENNEKELVNFLDIFSKNLTQFEIKLKGFGSFPPRVIFIKIEDESDLKVLFGNLMDKIDQKIKDQIRKPERFNAHMTLATRDLTRDNYKKAWQHYKNEIFECGFPVQKIALLKHNGRFWEIFYESVFGNI